MGLAFAACGAPRAVTPSTASRRTEMPAISADARCAETPLRLDFVAPLPETSPLIAADSDGTLWVTEENQDQATLRLTGYDARGRVAERGPSVRLREPVGLAATTRGLVVYGWDRERHGGFAQWFDARGNPTVTWDYPGNVVPLRLGAHADRSVTLVFAVDQAEATLYGRVVHGRDLKPGQPVNVDSAPALVAVRLEANDTLRWLVPLPEAATRKDGGLATSGDGRLALWWGERRWPTGTGGAVELWDPAGQRLWTAPFESAAAATFDDTGALVTVAALSRRTWVGPIQRSVPPNDGPVVLDRYGSVATRRVLDEGIGRGSLGADAHRNLYWLGEFEGRRLFDGFPPPPAALSSNYGLVAFAGEHPFACVTLTGTESRLAVTPDGRALIATSRYAEPVRVNGRSFGPARTSLLLQFSLTGSPSR